MPLGFTILTMVRGGGLGVKAICARPALTRRSRTGIPHPMIYKLLRTPEWQALREGGSTAGAPVDLEDGYIHFSTRAQVAETAAKHFAGVEGLWLVAVEEAAVADALHWEVSRGGAEFPHLYAPLRFDQVAWAQPLPLADGVHVFPAGAE